MDIREISQKIYKYQKKRAVELKTELTPEIIFLHLSEEIGEIARQLVNKNLSFKIRKYDEENLKEEIVQAILDLFTLAECFKIDLEKELPKKITEIMNKKKEGRDKQ